MEKEGFSIGFINHFFFKGMTTMKKLTTLLLAAGMICAASAPASAVDVKMDGEYMFSYILGERVGTGDNFDEAGQRMRLGMTFTANENLSGYLQLQAGIDADKATGYDWGTSNNANTKLGVRQAYIDWMIPQTTVKVRMGKQLVGLPKDAFGKNAVMNPGVNSRDGVVVSSPVTDWLDLTAFWVRAGYLSDNGPFGGIGNDTDTSKKSDLFSVAAALKFDGFSVTPYVMYGAIDKGNTMQGSTDGTLNIADGNAYWFGATATMTYFDPFTLKLSGAYGTMNYEGVGAPNDRDGWYIQAKASYKTAYGTPILGGWYGSGDDSDAKYARQGWIPTVGGRFHPTIGYCAGEYGLFDTTSRHNIAGTWGVQAGIEDVSFLEDLSHTFTVTYWQGTNDDKLAGGLNPWEYMTTSDSVVEFNLANTYNIYKNLTAVLELSYMITDYDKGDHGMKNIDKDGWSTALNFAYKF